MSTNYIMSLFVVRENGEVTLPIKNIWNHKLKSFQEFLEWTEDEMEEAILGVAEGKIAYQDLSQWIESHIAADFK